MIQKILLICLISLNIYAAETTTKVTFTDERSMDADKHGNYIYERDVTIDTHNFKVENFWNKFSFSGEGKSESEFSTLSKTGTVRISVEATSLCSIYTELDSAGCSGQKPFLINDEAIAGKITGNTISLIFQKDYNGTDILYTNTNSDVFYPLDIERNEHFYKKQGHDAKSFFGLFGRLFNTFFGDDGFFSSFFNFGVSDSDGNPVEDIRQRYIANIVSGVDQDHLLEKGVTPLETTKLNDPVSLIDYSETVVEEGECRLFFFKYSADNGYCNFMAGMPFISLFSSATPTTTYEIDTIQVDTENSLIAFASAYTEMTIDDYTAGTTYVKESKKSGLLSGMVKGFFCMFSLGSCGEAEEIEEPMSTSYVFDDDSAVNLTMAVTNEGDSIDSFQTFRLKSINSIAANQHTCHVDYNGKYGSSWDHNFKGSESETKLVNGDCIENCGLFDRNKIYEQVEVDNTYGYNSDAKTPSQWLSWCDDLMKDYTGGTHRECLFPILGIGCRDVPNTVTEGRYEILSNSYVNSSKRGLILDLELIELNPKSKAVTLRYELISTKH